MGKDTRVTGEKVGTDYLRLNPSILTGFIFAKIYNTNINEN